MKCISPIKIRDPKSDDNDAWIEVPCSKCAFCLQRRQSDWIIRIKNELKDSNNAIFLTLTYDEQTIPISSEGQYELNKKDLQNFWKRLRKNFKQKIRYYAVGEYGTNTDRPHYHAIVFNLSTDCVDVIDRAWNNGFIKVGTVTDDSIAYVTKYLINLDLVDFQFRQRPFACMSLGIGKNFIDKAGHHMKKNLTTHVIDKGYKKPIPRYYRDKIYDKDEREIIAYENSNAAKFDYDKKYNALVKKGYDADKEYKIRVQAMHDKIFKMSEKNRKL